VSPLRTRPATDADAPVLARLLAELGYPAPSDVMANRLRATRDDGGEAMVAVGADDVPIGLACMTTHVALHADAPTGYITALVTSSTARGTGVGRALVAAAESWARSRGCTKLSVTSAEHRADAHAFYPRCGMPYTGRRFSKGL